MCNVYNMYSRPIIVDVQILREKTWAAAATNDVTLGLKSIFSDFRRGISKVRAFLCVAVDTRSVAFVRTCVFLNGILCRACSPAGNSKYYNRPLGPRYLYYLSTTDYSRRSNCYVWDVKLKHAISPV